MYSKLVTYVQPSPSYNLRRNAAFNPSGKVTKITVHHAAGVVGVEALGAIFADPNRQASANYGIGTDGRIACFVPDEYRSWASGSPENDYAAITIEVANSGGGPDWPISAAAYKSLIELCADICMRHGFTLNFTGDASGSLTMHRYFANTLCPGPYLANLFPAIADEVNARVAGAAASGRKHQKEPETNNQPKEGYTMNMRIMQQGDSGEDVRALQILLKGNGYDLGTYGPKGDGVDGQYGAATAKAVRKLEEDRDLDLDEGIAGQQVMASLLGL